MNATVPVCSDKVKTSGGNLGLNINKKFRIDHVTIGIDTTDFTAIEEKLPTLQAVLQFARRETIHTESGSWSNLYMGYSNGYVEIIEHKPTEQIPFSIAFRSLTKGTLDSFRAVLEKKEIPYDLGTERIMKGNKSLDWFRCIEITDSVGPMPFFFIEYTNEYLEEIGQSEEMLELIDCIGTADTQSGINSIDVSLDGPVFDLFSDINHGKQMTVQRAVDKQVIRFGESSELIVCRSKISRLSEIRLPAIGQMGNPIITDGRWKIGTDGNALVIRKVAGRNETLIFNI